MKDGKEDPLLPLNMVDGPIMVCYGLQGWGIDADRQSSELPRVHSTRDSTPNQLPLLPNTLKTSRRNG
jgi:hypothetical protein